MGMLNIGASALNSAYTQLQTTSHNIANASTPGYSRQETVQRPAQAHFGRGVFIGGGVENVEVRRQYNDYLSREVNAATASLSQSNARSESLARLETIFADNEGGIGILHDELRESLADVVNQPFDPAGRTVALARAEAFADRIASTDGALDALRNDTDQALRQEVNDLNADLVALAGVNRRLQTTQGNDSPPNDLLDERDLLVERINEGLKANAIINDDQSVTVFAATGDTLVIADDSTTLNLVSDIADPERLRLSIDTPGQPITLNERMLGGGAVAGLLTFRNEDINLARTQLGRYAASIGGAYNAQQAVGLDLQGNAGTDLFAVGSARSVAASDNAGNAQFGIAIDDASVVQASDYQLDFMGGQYRLTRLSDGEQTAFAGLPQTIDGLTLTIEAGAVANGDRYTLKSASAFAGRFDVAINSPDEWAAAFAAAPVLGQANEGSLSVADFAVLDNDPNVTAAVSLVFTGPGTYDLTGPGTGNPTGVAYTPGDAIDINGWRIELDGTPQAGDRVDIAPRTDTAADNRNARRLLDIGESRIVDGQTPSEAFGSLLGVVGSQAFAAATEQRQAQIWQTNATTARDEVSGVNLDEEAARLIQFQQAYQAAAKVISSAQNMFDSILSIMR